MVGGEGGVGGGGWRVVIYLRGEVRVLTVITIVGVKCHDAREWRRWWVGKGGGV